MPYLLNTSDDQRAMLEAIGASSLEELFSVIPQELQLDGSLQIPAAMTELELAQHVTQLGSRNKHVGNAVCFLGGGSYDHFIPAVVDVIASRGEFYTSYTPYQPEVSQGNLQAMFEYQTLITELTGLDVSNASLYDGGSATIEAVLMAMSSTKRLGKVVTVDTVHPEFRQIMSTYLVNLGCELVTVPSKDGVIDLNSLEEVVDDQTACILLQHPNFFGAIEDVQAISDLAHQHGALSVQVFDPVSLGLLKRPGDLGVDIAVAEGQCLGTPLQYGGPYLGILACREKYVRRLPGRIAGETVDRRGRRCWVLTLQTREQHIRREKATSNICTNQGLFALRAAVYLAMLGPEGLREVSQACLNKTQYARRTLNDSARLELAFAAPTFKEFVVRDSQADVAGLLEQAADNDILAGIPLAPWYPHLSDCFLVAVTEKRTREEIEALAECLG